MTDQKTRKPGDFCWVELCTSDITKAKEFYKTILGWQYDEVPMSPDSECAYTMVKANGTEVAGAYQITPEIESAGAKPHWGSYVMTEDANTATKKAKELGATVYREPFDVGEHGRMAVLADPTGAVFYLWQPKKELSETPEKGTPGSLGWNELATNDTEKAAKFYSSLFGWETQTQEVIPGKTYTTFLNKGTPVAGMLALTEEWNGAPPHWGVYFTVSNIDETLATVTKHAGTILYDPIEAPDVGRFTMIRDPQGVHFSVIQFAAE